MRFLIAGLLALCLLSCSKDKELTAAPNSSVKNVQVSVIATHGSDTAVIATSRTITVTMR